MTAAATPSPSPTAARTGQRVTVIRVVDGDTLEVAYPNGTQDTVRLLGVDTPEVHAETNPDEFEGIPDSAAGRDCLRAEGEDASQYVKRRLADETVTLRFDEQADRRGYYGRLLAYVLHEGQNINYRLVADGYGRVYDSTFSQRAQFYAAEDDAQAADVGVWRCQSVATATPTATPGDGGSGSLAVVTVHADAAGNDHENENDEYIVFENTGDATLDMSGWTVRDEAGHTYVVPGGFTLDPGAQVTLYTGAGTDTETELYWGSDSAIWNNGGDTIIVETDDGDRVIEYEYP